MIGNLHVRMLCVSLSVLALLASGGCGGGEAEVVTLTGKVTLDGKPVDKASVAFIGRNGARLSTAQTGASGDFKITAALGSNAVTVSKAPPPGAVPPPPSGEDMLMPTDQEYKKMQQAKAVDSGIPLKYSDPKTSGINIDVVDGMSDVELALSSS